MHSKTFDTSSLLNSEQTAVPSGLPQGKVLITDLENYVFPSDSL